MGNVRANNPFIPFNVAHKNLRNKKHNAKVLQYHYISLWISSLLILFFKEDCLLVMLFILAQVSFANRIEEKQAPVW